MQSFIFYYYYHSLLSTSGQRGTLVWVHSAPLPGLRVPGCRGTGDRGGYRHRQRAVFRLGTHGHCAELPGRLPVRQVEHQGQARFANPRVPVSQNSAKASSSSHQLQLIPVYERGSRFQPSAIEMADGQTSPPQLLTEADLIALMEKHGIGKTMPGWTRPRCQLSIDFRTGCCWALAGAKEWKTEEECQWGEKTVAAN